MERIGEGTWFAIDRKIFSSDIWYSSPWKLKIFIYLLGHANHEDANFMGIELKRGQLIRSYRTIAKDCGYKIGYRLKQPSLDTVRRICEELTKELRIVQRTVHLGTIFTINNYNDLQPRQNKCNVQRTPQSSYSDRTVTVQDNNNKELLKNKKDIPATRRHKIPSDFSLTDNLVQIANKHGLNGDRIQTVFEHFKAHHESRGSAMLNWDKAWLTWVINDKKFGKSQFQKQDQPITYTTNKIWTREEQAKKEREAFELTEKLRKKLTEGA